MTAPLALDGPDRLDAAGLARVRALFVAPHLDDAVLSCGGTIMHHWIRDHHPAVVTVAAGIPADYPLTDSVRQFHARYGVGETDADRLLRIRRDEAAAACRVLGAINVWLPYTDAIYRGHRWDDVCLAPCDEDDLTQRIAADLETVWRTTDHAMMFLPLGLGNHIDHRLCASIHQRLRRAGAMVWHYEETPYVLQVAAGERWLDGLCLAPMRRPVKPYLEQRLAAMGLEARIVDVTAYIEHRLTAIACFTSQLDAIFKGQNYRTSILEYSRSLASVPERFAERFWTMAGAA